MKNLRVIQKQKVMFSSPRLSDYYAHFERSGAEAADLWLRSPVRATMAEFRDMRFRSLVAVTRAHGDRTSCRSAFDDGFSRVIAAFITCPARFARGGVQ
ncbi:hypothetical protein [Burkholderia sp. LMG 21824]|uniref:hypothetical protein n=1 Tax=Burkholderia sp. LMG 21824 TaxID=3158172 RepID=UPI003C2C353E